MANHPTTEVIDRDGEPLWRICSGGICVEDRCGSRAIELFDALCRSHGIEPTVAINHKAPSTGKC